MKNLKLYFSLVLLSAMPFLLNAQYQNRLSIGPRVGINFSNINQNNTKSLPGLVLGLTSTYSFNEKSGLTVDALYSSEGYKSGNTEFDIDYIKVPILYNLFYGNLGERFRPKFYLGLAPGFLVNNLTGNEGSSQYKSATLDVVGGLGFNYRIANRVWLNTDLRAATGLFTIHEIDVIKNKTIQLSFGVAYGI